jgi:hypothetical protein
MTLLEPRTSRPADLDESPGQDSADTLRGGATQRRESWDIRGAGGAGCETGQEADELGLRADGGQAIGSPTSPIDSQDWTPPQAHVRAIRAEPSRPRA